MTRQRTIIAVLGAALFSLAMAAKAPAFADNATPPTAAPAKPALPAVAPRQLVKQVTTAEQMLDAMRGAKLVLAVGIGPDCADCTGIPALLSSQVTKHPNVKFVIVSGDDFRIPADELPMAAMMEPGTRFMFGFGRPVHRAYLEANVKLTASNIDAWTNERIKAALPDLWDMRRYDYLQHALMPLEERALHMYALGDSRPVRLERARLEEQAANCVAEMLALQTRIEDRAKQATKRGPVHIQPAR
jgi:hypothetical protein